MCTHPGIQISNLILCMFLPVFHRCHIKILPENLCEIGLGRKSGGGRNIRNRIVGIFQQMLCTLQTRLIQILNRGESGIFCERVHHIIFVHMCQTGQRVQGNVFCIVRVQVFFDLSTFFCHSDRVDRYGNELLGPYDLQDQNLKQMLADGLRTVLCGPDFVEHLAEQFMNTGIMFKIAEYLCAELKEGK